MDNEQGFDDGLVHNHAWAREPAIPPSLHRLPGPPDTMLIPTPSTVYRDDQSEG